MKAPKEFVSATCKGVVWTKDDVIQSVNEWRCPASGLMIEFITITRSVSNWRLVTRLPSGEEWSTPVWTWLKGHRPDLFKMDRHIIQQEVTDYGLTFIGWGKRKSVPHVEFLLPSGEKSSMSVCHWRNKKRPQLVDMERHIFKREVEEYGLTFVGWGKTTKGICSIVFLLPSGEESYMTVGNWRKGHRPTKFAMDRHTLQQDVENYGLMFLGWGKVDTSPIIHYMHPNGEESSIAVSDWRMGKRPDGMVGWYCEANFERKPELCDAPALLYYIKFSSPKMLEPFYKIGITRKSSWLGRFGRIHGMYKVEVIQEISMSLYHAWSEEQRILKQYRKHRYIPNPPLVSGNTECFSIDILGIDTSANLEAAD